MNVVSTSKTDMKDYEYATNTDVPACKPPKKYIYWLVEKQVVMEREQQQRQKQYFTSGANLRDQLSHIFLTLPPGDSAQLLHIDKGLKNSKTTLHFTGHIQPTLIISWALFLHDKWKPAVTNQNICQLDSLDLHCNKKNKITEIVPAANCPDCPVRRCCCFSSFF